MMTESDQESTSNTDDLISGVHRFDDISPLSSPCTPDSKLQARRQIMSEDKDSGKGSSTETPAGTCFDKSNPNTVKSKSNSPRSRSLSPQSRIRVHYTDSAREALDLANKSYERLVEESEERHQLSILINKRDAERAEFERALRESEEKRNQPKVAEKLVQSHSTPSVVNGLHRQRPAQPITVIQEHIRFAESILASPPSSESGRRSRSLSPSPQARRHSPSQYSQRSGNGSRSTSPLTRPGEYPVPLSTRKKLSFDAVDRRPRSPLLSRSGREKTAQEIKARATNDYIEATSGGLRYPMNRLADGRMAATSGRQSAGDTSRSMSMGTLPAADPAPPTDIYITPEKSKQFMTVRPGPMSSTPHRPQHREPLRELSPSRLYVSEQQTRAANINNPVSVTRGVPNTPSTCIKNLQSVRLGLRKLMNDETDAAEEAVADTPSRADTVSLRIESTINAENQLLRDQLTRERNLRKQIEADKHELQAQLLESKDRLHHLSSTLKQKDNMMKQLDQNLDEVVNGWQKHELENKQRTESLTHNIRKLERELEEENIHAAGLETELASNVDELRRERDTSKEYARDACEQHSRHQEELTDVRNDLAREMEKAARLDLERAQATEGRVHVEQQLQTLQQTLDQERDHFKEREQELLNKINEITSVQIAVLEQEAARTKAQAEKIEELDAKARRYEQDAESQRHLVSSKMKELERLQSLLELTDAKHQNALRQLESKLRVELELRVSQAKDDGLKRMADGEINLQQAHQRQLADVVAEQNRQMGAMRERFNNEINRVKSYMDDQVKTAESALTDTKQELESVLSLKENAETQRDDLSSRLQAVLTLLGAATNSQVTVQQPLTLSAQYRPSTPLMHQLRSSNVSSIPPQVSYAFTPADDQLTDESSIAPLRPATPQSDLISTPFHPKDPNSTEDSNVTSYTDTSAVSGDQESGTPGYYEPPQGTGFQPTTDKERQQQPSKYHQQYEQHRKQYKREAEKPDDPETAGLEDKDERDSVVSTTETYDLNEHDSLYRHKRQAELQDYIKKLLNRSVGEPLIETRIDLDESHISVISGLQDHSVILHDAEHHPHSPKKAFRHEMVGQTPPVKGSTKKVNPKEIASLINKYGSGEGTTPSTSEYIEYLKAVAVNNHTGLLKEFDHKSTQPPANRNSAKRGLADTFNTSSTRHSSHKRTTSRSRLVPSSPESQTVSKQAKEKDKPKVKRHSNSSARSQAIWK